MFQLLSQAKPGQIYNPALDPAVGSGEGFPIVKAFLTNSISMVFALGGLIAFAFLLWGGLEYILAGGDKERTQNATKKITAALVGLVLLLSVFAIIFIVQTLFGINLLEITIPSLSP